MSYTLAGKSALITGASRGIGAATALSFARAGANRLLLHYGSYREGAESVASQARSAGADVEIIGADLSTDAGIQQLCSDVRGREFDILVNNAGHLVGRARLTEATPDLYDRIFTLNTKSAYFLSQAVVPAMLQRKSGVIINLSSIAARHGGGIGATIYAAAKAAVATMTKGMAKELAPSGIRVNAVSPGTVDNYFHEKYSTKQMLETMLASAPAGKLGTNEEVADLILFLSSDASSYIHGQTIEINGGMYMV